MASQTRYASTAPIHASGSSLTSPHTALHQLRSSIISRLTKGQEWTEVDMMIWISRATLELIGQAGFGYTFNALDGGSHEYSDSLKRVMWVLSSVWILLSLTEIHVTSRNLENA